MKQILLNNLDKVLEEIEQKSDEYASNIMGHQETAHMDIIYEDYVTFLEYIQNVLERAVEIIITTDEGIQKNS